MASCLSIVASCLSFSSVSFSFTLWVVSQPISCVWLLLTLRSILYARFFSVSVFALRSTSRDTRISSSCCYTRLFTESVEAPLEVSRVTNTPTSTIINPIASTITKIFLTPPPAKIDSFALFVGGFIIKSYGFWSAVGTGGAGYCAELLGSVGVTPDT